MKTSSGGQGRTAGVGFESGLLPPMIDDETFEAGIENPAGCERRR
jgi:hypothetical protein